MTSERDPWADLADSLGATPGAEPQPPRAAEPPRPRPTQQPARPHSRPTPAGDWDALASDLGIEGGHAAANEPPRSTREPAPPRRPAEDRKAHESRSDQRHDETPSLSGWADEVAEPAERKDRTSGDRDESGGGERRGRRRRGRRGGRGRRDGVRPAADREGLGIPPDQATDDFPRPQVPERTDGVDDHRDEATTDAAASTGGEGDGDKSGRRRRRGRRGGRRRGRSTRERLADERMAAEQPESEQRLDDLEDEPLPTGYGAAPRSVAASRTEPERSSGGKDGERRGRRRRRRGSGSSSESSSTGSRRDSGRESGRRRGNDSPRSSSRSDRSRRRDDFAPVAGRFDEDDEGLEFLGVEEAGRAAQAARDRRPSSVDESIAESGLDTVREVPSWVEAIGIVIASNLDARNKSTGGRK